MNGCIRTHLEVIPTDSLGSGLHLRTRSQDENGSHVGEQFGVSCALILTFNSVGLTQIHL